MVENLRIAKGQFSLNAEVQRWGGPGHPLPLWVRLPSGVSRSLSPKKAGQEARPTGGPIFLLADEGFLHNGADTVSSTSEFGFTAILVYFFEAIRTQEGNMLKH